MSKTQYTFPNQKIITIHKAVSDKNHLYGIFNQEALFSACRTLTGNELKLYLYLCCNQANYCLALSPKAVSAEVGAHEDSIRTAIQALIKKGYLVNQSGNNFNFYEYPKQEVKSAPVHLSPVKTPIVPQEKNEIPPVKFSDTPDKTPREIIQRNYKNNKTNNNVCLETSVSDPWEKEFQRIKVTFHTHSLTKLQEVIGKEADVSVVRKIITENYRSFESALSKTEGYRFGILLKLIKAQYSKWESFQRQMEYEVKTPEERRRDWEYSCFIQKLSKAPPKPKEPEVDINALLDEIYGCEDEPECKSEESTKIFEIMERMKNEADLDDAV